MIIFPRGLTPTKYKKDSAAAAGRRLAREAAGGSSAGGQRHRSAMLRGCRRRGRALRAARGAVLSGS